MKQMNAIKTNPRYCEYQTSVPGIGINPHSGIKTTLEINIFWARFLDM